VRDTNFRAIVLRTVSTGPGVSLLEALGASGVTTINNAQAVRTVRDKVVMAATAHAGGIAFPQTYFVADASMLEQLPDELYPIVVKPSLGGFGNDVHLVHDREDLHSVAANGTARRDLVAQRWIPNSGYDMKLYNTGQEIHTVRRRSSLLGGGDTERERVPATSELRDLTVRIGKVFGLDIYGADVVESAEGWVVIDVNDFPSFGTIDSAPREVATTILEIARRSPRPE
jgi:ribosomal protein S6--L-glutamate ligase